MVEVIEGVKITESGWARRLILGFMGVCWGVGVVLREGCEYLSNLKLRVLIFIKSCDDICLKVRFG